MIPACRGFTPKSSNGCAHFIEHGVNGCFSPCFITDHPFSPKPLVSSPFYHSGGFTISGNPRAICFLKHPSARLFSPLEIVVDAHPTRFFTLRGTRKLPHLDFDNPDGTGLQTRPVTITPLPYMDLCCGMFSSLGPYIIRRQYP